MSHLTRTLVAAAAATFAMLPAAHALDADAAQSLFKKNNCTRCHAPEKDKKGAALKKIAKKHAGQPDAVDQLVKHVTSGGKVKLSDGTEENHKIIETTDEAELKNLAEWILSHQ
jgi:cytochrome c